MRCQYSCYIVTSIARHPIVQMCSITSSDATNLGQVNFNTTRIYFLWLLIYPTYFKTMTEIYNSSHFPVFWVTKCNNSSIYFMIIYEVHLLTFLLPVNTIRDTKASCNYNKNDVTYKTNLRR